jgi:hypothetical protein
VLKVLIVCAIVGGLGWLGYDRLRDNHPTVAPVQVKVDMPNPLGGTPPSDGSDQILIP